MYVAAGGIRYEETREEMSWWEEKELEVELRHEWSDFQETPLSLLLLPHLMACGAVDKKLQNLPWYNPLD